MKRKAIIGLSWLLTLVAATATAGTLDDAKKRGHVVCGMDSRYAGFAVPDEKGVWTGFNVEICKAIGAAAGIDVRFRALTSTDRFVALASGEVDVLTMQNTWTMSRDTKLGIRFVVTTYYDSQGFLVRKSLNAKSLADLNGANACVISGSTAEVNLADLFKARKMTYTPVTFKSGDESRLAYGANRCDFIMGDRANLANMRTLQKDPREHTLLPEGFGREPLSLAVRQGDDRWFQVVRWTYYALLTAEHLGITQANLNQMLATATEAETTNLLGKTASLGADLGLDNQFAVRAIRAVGNYGEIFERHIGPKTPMGLERGINSLWTKGGLQYAPPFK